VKPSHAPTGWWRCDISPPPVGALGVILLFLGCAGALSKSPSNSAQHGRSGCVGGRPPPPFLHRVCVLSIISMPWYTLPPYLQCEFVQHDRPAGRRCVGRHDGLHEGCMLVFLRPGRRLLPVVFHLDKVDPAVFQLDQ
jgi:hypothetical protein